MRILKRVVGGWTSKKKIQVYISFPLLIYFVWVSTGFESESDSDVHHPQSGRVTSIRTVVNIGNGGVF